jgi:hypothetical protein
MGRISASVAGRSRIRSTVVKVLAPAADSPPGRSLRAAAEVVAGFVSRTGRRRPVGAGRLSRVYVGRISASVAGRAYAFAALVDPAIIKVFIWLPPAVGDDRDDGEAVAVGLPLKYARPHTFLKRLDVNAPLTRPTFMHAWTVTFVNRNLRDLRHASICDPPRPFPRSCCKWSRSRQSGGAVIAPATDNPRRLAADRCKHGIFRRRRPIYTFRRGRKGRTIRSGTGRFNRPHRAARPRAADAGQFEGACGNWTTQSKQGRLA